MPTLNRDHARAIAKKLRATIDKSGKAHDIAYIYHNGVLVAHFGIRRGSDRNLPHGHIPDALHLRPRQTLNLAICTLTREQWIQIMTDAGWIESEESEAESD